MAEALIPIEDRCQGQTRTGQCHKKALPGQLFCETCQNTPVNIRRRTTALKLTKLSDQQRFEELNLFNQVHLMQDAIKIAAIQLEETHNSRPEVGADLATVEKTNKLLQRIQSLGRDLCELQIQANETYTRDALNQYTLGVVRIIGDELSRAKFEGWENVQRSISTQLLALVSDLRNPVQER